MYIYVYIHVHIHIQVFEIIDLEPDICKGAAGACVEAQQGMRIECADVVFAYQKRLVILVMIASNMLVIIASIDNIRNSDTSN